VVAKGILQELVSQRSNLKLIASENFSSIPTQLAMANLLTDKYAEGFPHSRFYAGCENVDLIEETACNLAKNLFGADHAYVQPHSGADANLVAFWAILSARVEQPALDRLGIKDSAELSAEDWNSLRQTLGNQKLLGMDLTAGGHLTHGAPPAQSGKWFNAVQYGVRPDDHLVDFDEVERLAREHRPKLIIAGGSAYPRHFDFARFRAIADEVDALLMVDMAHFAGLVAAGEHPTPFGHAHVVTTTTHKTLRGPRGGMVLTDDEAIAKKINSAVFPGLQGGPLMHVIAAKAVAFREAAQPSFSAYAAGVVANAAALAGALADEGFRIVSGGTDNHLMLVDLRPFGVTGKVAQEALDRAGITCNKNAIPNDPEKPFVTSGLRLGTAAVTTAGMGEEQMTEIASLIARVLRAPDDAATRDDVKEQSARLCSKFTPYPVPPA